MKRFAQRETDIGFSEFVNSVPLLLIEPDQPWNARPDTKKGATTQSE